jgi:pre-mRNA-processing factor 19
LAEHGTDPVTGTPLSKEDLIELKSSNVVHPRPPTRTSLPALLATFQNEWDATVLETFQLKSQLAQVRQELSTALYDYEGALRVLARITKERDDARAALAKVQVKSRPQDSEMELDEATELPEKLLEQIDDTLAR